MTPEELNAYWTRHFPQCPPVGYLFKHLYRDRCARFRTMSNGRVYPSSEAERAEMAHRQREVFQYLFEQEPAMVLITTIPSELETPPAGTPGFLNFDPQGRFLHSLGMHEFELEFATPSYWHLFMSVRAQQPGQFDVVLRASSEDPASTGVLNTLFLGPSSRRVLYVYPGGLDAVMESAVKRDQVRARFPEWSL